MTLLDSVSLSMSVISLLSIGFWYDLNLMNSIWMWVAPPYSIGFLTFILYMTVMIDDMNNFVLPLIFSYLIGAHFYGGFSLHHYIWNNPLECGGYTLGLIGCIWSLWRLKSYLREEKTKIFLRRISQQPINPTPTTTRSRTRTRKQIDEDDDDSEDKYTAVSKDNNLSDDRISSIAENFLAENKMRIYTWIMYWPFSFVYYVTHNMVREIIDYCFGRLRKMYLELIRAALKNIQDEDNKVKQT